MLLALFADIHANREAFSACLAHAQAVGAQRHVFLGDYVGYGADPEWVVDEVMRQVETGALAVRGNHDQAVLDTDVRMNETARAAIAWTRARLSERQRDFLRSLPLTVADADHLYVHASAHRPEKW